MQNIIQKIIEFRNERDWKQFHTPENLAKSISIEAGELLEIFQWNNDYDKQKAAEELADIMTYCILMADSIGVDIKQIIEEKMIKNNEKYPVEKAKGNSKKYTEL